MPAQADGSYPRLNSANLKSGDYNTMICSFVGKLKSQDAAGAMVEFECSDGGIVQMDAGQAELPEGILNNDQAPVVEAIAQVDGGSVNLFIVRELTSDTNLETYNKMLLVQQNPKFACYFSPLAGGATMGQ